VDKELEAALTEALHTLGRAKVLDDLRQFKRKNFKDDLTLTVVVNSGIHYLPPEYLRGEVFIVSEGTLDLSSQEIIHEVFRKILMRAAKKLKSRPWRRVYVIPFGPTPLSMQVKLLIYRICGIESVDVMNVPGQPRIDLCLDLRQLIVDSDYMKE
jgi:hypothetical protein